MRVGRVGSPLWSGGFRGLQQNAYLRGETHEELTYLVVTALVAITVLAPAAVAQEETTIIEETTVYPEGAPSAGDTGGATEGAGAQTGDDATGTGDTMSDETMSGGGTVGTTSAETTDGDPLPTSGGPGILAPAVALLLGAGVVTIAVLRRGR